MKRACRWEGRTQREGGGGTDSGRWAGGNGFLGGRDTEGKTIRRGQKKKPESSRGKTEDTWGKKTGEENRRITGTEKEKINKVERRNTEKQSGR